MIRARFADADFFVRDDRKHRLEDFLPRLGTLIFQTKLGSMLDKSRRVTALMPAWSNLGLDARRPRLPLGRELCKADLATRMVVEMTSLQGIIGRHYALASGESEAVAQAIYEHNLPRFAGDALPQACPGWPSGWPTGWTRWWACSPPAWRLPARAIPLPTAARPSAWCRR